MTDAAVRLERRAVAPLIRSLGPRWAIVHDGRGARHAEPCRYPSPTLAGRALPSVVVALGDVPGDVRGAIDAWPVQSESVTGVLVALGDGDAASRACREALRVLQPGGFAVFLAAWRAEAFPGFDEALKAAGLAPARRIAVRRADAEPSALARWLPWIESRRTAAATGDQRIVCAVVATAPGGFATDYPTSRSLLSAMFVPRGLTRSRPGSESAS